MSDRILEALERQSAGSFDPSLVRSFARTLVLLASASPRHFGYDEIAKLSTLPEDAAWNLMDLATKAGVVEQVYELECPSCGHMTAVLPEGRQIEEISVECDQEFCHVRLPAPGGHVFVFFNLRPDYWGPSASTDGR
jgi:hypothetical protein